MTIKSLQNHAATFLKDCRGNILPIAAGGVLLTVAMVGSAVDLSQAYRANGRLQAACDAAVLAGRKEVSSDGFDQAAADRADEYFVANFDAESHQGSEATFTPVSEDNGHTVTGMASVSVDTVLMKIFGMNEFNLTATCQASLGVGNSDVVLVLDTTGSMGSNLSGTSQTRIQALRGAVKNFYDTIYTSTGSTNARVRYGFVPYSSSVNVGRLIHNVNPDYIVDDHTYQSRKAIFETVIDETVVGWEDPVTTTETEYDNTDYGNWSLYSDTRYNSRSACNSALPDEPEWANYGSPTTDTDTYVNSNGQQVTVTTETQRERRRDYGCYRYSHKRYFQIKRWYYRDRNQITRTISDPIYEDTEASVFSEWEYRPVSYDVSSYKTFVPTTTMTGSDVAGDPAPVSSSWEGCIEERQTVSEDSFSYSTVFGMTPSGAHDLDIDTAPWNDATRWAPMWPQVAYRRWNDAGDYTTATTGNGSQVSSRCPAKAKLLAEMDEGAFDAYADSLQAQGNTYLDLGLLWGARLSSTEGIFGSNVADEPSNGGQVSRHLIFMTDGVMQPNNIIQTSYGIEFFDRRVTEDGSSNHTSRHTSRFLAICQAIKAKGIRLWVVAFTTGLSSDLTTCASDSSSFTANDADELDDAFQEIATAVGELRVTR
ncbi:MAG: pilus assembly protein TadG [Sphingomonadaceae bacterium]|nr:pilus assembly protein TadG [Sphingomonadaceae bacterium]